MLSTVSSLLNGNTSASGGYSTSPSEFKKTNAIHVFDQGITIYFLDRVLLVDRFAEGSVSISSTPLVTIGLIILLPRVLLLVRLGAFSLSTGVDVIASDLTADLTVFVLATLFDDFLLPTKESNSSSETRAIVRLWGITSASSSLFVARDAGVLRKVLAGGSDNVSLS